MADSVMNESAVLVCRASLSRAQVVAVEEVKGTGRVVNIALCGSIGSIRTKRSLSFCPTTKSSVFIHTFLDSVTWISSKHEKLVWLSHKIRITSSL